eukprot:CAMPEP_0197525900 /NCGR_PEP_ID=MMETSP1318-20131121/15072_1 /TAXON_ID=552666 /ORGANISM="Partenskyella glossopodia, Strain RCC365" /LENGTH=59 /DNA_ID=CAMNT_0043079731 /DNA_START=496 /DNA_END=675 /DNA_ORIENTATION=+
MTNRYANAFFRSIHAQHLSPQLGQGLGSKPAATPNIKNFESLERRWSIISCGHHTELQP